MAKTNHELTDSDRATIRYKLAELYEEIEGMTDTDVCGVLVGVYCYAVSKSGGTLDNAKQIVQETWVSLDPRQVPS